MWILNMLQNIKKAKFTLKEMQNQFTSVHNIISKKFDMQWEEFILEGKKVKDF